MKVIHLISGGDSGGAKTHVHSLLYNLTKTVDITLVCFMDGPFAREAADMGIPTTVLPGNNVAKTLAALKDMTARGGYDIIHCHGSRGNMMGALLRCTGLPVVSTVHSDYKLDYLGRPLAALTYGRINAWALRKIPYRIGVSDTMRELFIVRGFPPDTTFSIYNGIDFGRAPHRFDPAAFYARIGADIAPGDVVVGAAARLDPVKDLATLIRGFARARTTVPQLRLIIAGEGAEKENLRALAAELGVGNDVFFSGWVGDMDEFYEAIHINTLTSISETFPYAITEGAFHSLPTVSSRVGGIPKLISDGVTGCLFSPGDDETLGMRLAELGADTALRARLGGAIHEAAAADFSMEATCRRQKEIYAAILRRAARQKAGRDGAVVCGAYGMGNAGDEAILEAIVGELRSIDPYLPITVMTRDPSGAEARLQVRAAHTFDLPAFRRAASRAALYVNGGGSLIQDVTSRRSLWYYLHTLRTAKKCGAKVLMYGCGIGPVLYASDKKRSVRTLNRYVDAITLREPDSLETLRRWQVCGPELILASDPALTLPAAPQTEVDELLQGVGADSAGRYICFALRRWPGFADKAAAFASAAAYAYEKHGLTPLFLSINHKNDGDAAALVCSAMGKTPYVSIPGPLPTPLTIGIMARMNAVVSMRLHGLIFAAGQGVPLVGVSYDPKVTAFIKCVNAECIELEALTAENLRAAVDSALGADAEALSASVKNLRSLERGNTETAARLLGY